MDKMTQEQRSRTMKHIRGKDTKIELVLRKPYGIRATVTGKTTKRFPALLISLLQNIKLLYFVTANFFMATIGKLKNRNLGKTRNIG